jgi:hypothetical protein
VPDVGLIKVQVLLDLRDHDQGLMTHSLKPG